ncbi:MAG: AraC family transcriptional regulator ligand-binding domain-containing protein [Sphingomonadales bacterium]|nr:AraC family transcriptional regulator ligand-binding domain-containing protein [Sphingomonadales bacterium]
MLDRLQLPIQHARLALSSFVGSEKLLEQVFADSGLSPEAIARPKFAFSARTLETVSNNLTRLFGPAWFLNMPVLWSLRVQSEFGSAVRFAATLREGFEVVAAFTHVRWPLGKVDMVEEGDVAWLRFHVVGSMSPTNARMVAALAALNLQTTIEAMRGTDIARLTYEFEGPPPDYEDKLAALLSGPSQWNCDGNRLLLPREMLDAVSMTAQEDSFRAMMQALRELAAARAQHRPVSAAVRAALGAAGPGEFGADAVARAVGMARRTMERRLREEGSAFRAIQDEAFKERLLTIAGVPGQTAEKVAEELGYHDASSLQRACRRWFGKTFGAIREERRKR